MMSTLHESHLADAELMQILDSELSADMEGAIGHLETCGECAQGLQKLRDEATLLGDWLDRAAFEEPASQTPVARSAGVAKTRTWNGSWLRAAAVLLLVAGPVAAVPQLRAWVVGIIGGAEAVEDRTARAADAADAQAPLTVRFTPGTASLGIAFDAAPAAGTLTITRTVESDAVLTITGTTGEGPVLSATGARIRNQPAGEASYALLVPRSVSEVVILVPGRDAVTFNRAAIDAGAVIRWDEQ